MLSQFLSIFLNVVTPVFILVALAFTLGPRLDIRYRSLSRTAYYLLIPAFIFDVLSQMQIDIVTAGRMITGISLVYLATGAAAWLISRLLGYGKEMGVAFLMTCVFGNVGNFGLAINHFRLGEAAMESATVYMLAINTISFSVCVLAAGWLRNGGFGALKTLVKTPGVIILPFALAFPLLGIKPPLLLQHLSNLLGSAMIPVMLLTLGLQLRESGRLQWGVPTFAACGVRLILGPAIAFLIIPLMGLEGLPASAGILQASMPAAVITAIVALENDVVPAFVTSVVFFSTVFSLLTLTVVMTFL